MAARRACVLVTGGAGFIGSHFVLSLLGGGEVTVITLDKLTYAGHLENLAGAEGADHALVIGDIADRPLVEHLLAEHRPAAIVNFAAETHVDRSIDAPDAFIQTNVVGVLALLQAARAYVASLPVDQARRFRFVQVSTDEVFGSAGPTGAFTEESRFAPSSPYAASKAGAEHLVRAHHETYGLPTIITRSSNTYGPRQLPEKLIPLVLRRALAGEPLPVYGDGRHARDWLHVDDHVSAIRLALDRGVPGRSYNVAASDERTNIEIVTLLCDLLDEIAPDQRPDAIASYRELITFVPDRPGHDRRYAMDTARIREELGWAPTVPLEAGLRRTVAWTLQHRGFCDRVARGVLPIRWRSAAGGDGALS
jgi:dTDP-glucose 4,6-dehydratase